MSQKENPSELQLDGVSEGIGALPKRIDRYGKAKNGALDVVDYMETLPQHQATAKRVKSCGDYLVFRHYFTVDRVRLHGASLCMKHLLCRCALSVVVLSTSRRTWSSLRHCNSRIKSQAVPGHIDRQGWPGSG